MGRQGYVKKNTIAGRRFESWPALEAHLESWVRDVADQRVHGTTGEAPIERFRRPSVDKKQIREIAAGRFIANAEAVLLLGPPALAS